MWFLVLIQRGGIEVGISKPISGNLSFIRTDGSTRGSLMMRKLTVLLLLAGSFLIADVAAFRGRYTTSGFDTLKHEGKQLSYKIQYWFDRRLR